MRRLPTVNIGFLVLAGSILICARSQAQAQTINTPFSNLDVRFGLAHGISAAGVPDAWTPGSVWHADASTAFYAGSVTVGIRFQPFSSRLPDTPDFRSLHLSVGWGLQWSGRRESTNELGFEIGDYFMVFDEDTYEGARKESELALGAYYRIQMKVSDTVGIFIRGGYTGVMTRHTLNFFRLTAGVVLHTQMPVWLRRILE